MSTKELNKFLINWVNCSWRLKVIQSLLLLPLYGMGRPKKIYLQTKKCQGLSRVNKR